MKKYYYSPQIAVISLKPKFLLSGSVSSDGTSIKTTVSGKQSATDFAASRSLGDEDW